MYDILQVQAASASGVPVLVHIDTTRSIDRAGVLVDVGLAPSSEGLEVRVVRVPVVVSPPERSVRELAPADSNNALPVVVVGVDSPVDLQGLK